MNKASAENNGVAITNGIAPAQTLSVLAGGIVLFAVLAFWVGAYLPTDAFVTFRYAENLAAGHGLAFNAGAPASEGYWSLLWVLLCAMFAKSGASLPATAPLVSMLLTACALVVAWDAMRARAGSWVQLALPVSLLATAGPVVVASRAGTDTGLFTLVLLLAARSLDRVLNSESAAAWATLSVALVACALCRFEGALVPVMAAYVLHFAAGDGMLSRRSGRIAIGATAVAVLAYHGWRVATFGDVFPNALAVRAGLHLGDAFVVQPDDVAPVGLYYVVAIAAAVAGAMFTRAPRDRFAAGMATVMFVVYVFIADAVPGLGRAAPLLALAAVAWPSALGALRGLDPQPIRPSVAGLMLAAAVLTSVGLVADIRIAARRIDTINEESLVALGGWLKEKRPDAVLAIDDPGAVAYYARARTVDLRPRSVIGGDTASRAEALVAAGADYVFLSSQGVVKSQLPPAQAQLVNDPAVRASYRALVAIRTAWDKDRAFVILNRRDAPKFTAADREAFPPGLARVRYWNE